VHSSNPHPDITRYFHIPVTVLYAILLLPQVRNFFIDTGLRWAYIFSTSFTLSFALTPLCIRMARKWNIVDRPNDRKVHFTDTPLLGGVAIFVAFLAALLINGVFSIKLWAILTASSLLFTLGIVDDVREISASVKLIVQIVCAVIVMGFGIILKVIPESLGPLSLAGNVFLTVMWIIGITNAMNFFDGMNGLAAGLGGIISFFLGMTAFQTDQPFLGWIAIAMMAGCLGFMPFNFRGKGKALLFLGDAGSTTIGFILACVAVYGEWSTDNPVEALAPPILIFGVLIFDMIHITADRILTGKVVNFRQWVEFVGKDHLHHRLDHVLGSGRKSVIFIFSLNFCLGASAIALRNARAVDAFLLMAQAGIIVVLITILERRGRKLSAECLEPDIVTSHPIDTTAHPPPRHKSDE